MVRRSSNTSGTSNVFQYPASVASNKITADKKISGPCCLDFNRARVTNPPLRNGKIIAHNNARILSHNVGITSLDRLNPGPKPSTQERPQRYMGSGNRHKV